MARTLNLGILAHVDAGKTSLTERLLYAAGLLDQPGRVDDGSTRTDSLELERQRGITIRSAVVSFHIDDVIVNLIDTPGHPDFIAEVERVLNVLDGVVLLVSAVEGVQAQTRVLTRTLQRLGIPTLFFVNKVDRQGADPARVMREITDKLTSFVLRMSDTYDAGSPAARAVPRGAEDSTQVTELVDLASLHDDALLTAYVSGGDLDYDRLRRSFRRQSRRALVHPVFFGSAVTGAGIASLLDGITEFLPCTAPPADGPPAGSVFRVERDSTGQKVAYVRITRGTLRARDRVPVIAADRREPESQDDRTNTAARRSKPEKVTRIELFCDGEVVGATELPAGRIGTIRGLSTVRIGDALGTPTGTPPQVAFAPPTLETVVVPKVPTDKGALHLALTQLAEQDPLIGVRQDDTRDEISVSLYGEVQKEVIQATLTHEFGVEAVFRESSTIYVERPIGVGSSVEYLEAASGTSSHQSLAPMIALYPHPFLATIGLRVEPAQPGAGVRFRLEVEPGSMPPALFRAVEEGVHKTLRQGLDGWQVTDCVITMTHSGYCPRQGHRGVQFDPRISSTANDFRNLTPLVLMAALRQAGTRVHEPVHRLRLEIPPDALATVAAELPRLDGGVTAHHTVGSSVVAQGEIPADRLVELQRRLPSWTHGEGTVEFWFDHYRPSRGPTPHRARTGPDPLNRRVYLLEVGRRTQLP